MADLINATLRDEMKRDERIVIFGEDVADCSREEYLKQKLVKGQGRSLQAHLGLQMRVRLRPRVQFSAGRGRNRGPRHWHGDARAEAGGRDSVLRLHLAGDDADCATNCRVIRWRSNNGFSCPVVIRVAIGGYLTGGAIYHSQCGESVFTHIPGLRVVFPSNALDAAGLLRTAIRCDDPVLFLEHKRLYRETYGRAAYPGPDYMIPFGKAKIVHPGTDLTVITYGAVVPRALQAAQKLEREQGVKVELIDLRTSESV